MEHFTQTLENHSAMSRSRALSETESDTVASSNLLRTQCIEAIGVENDESLAMTLAPPTPPPPPAPIVYKIEMPVGARIYEAKEPPSRPLDNSAWVAEAGRSVGMTVRATVANLGLRGRGTVRMPDGGGDVFQRGKLIIHVVGASEVEVSCRFGAYWALHAVDQRAASLTTPCLTSPHLTCHLTCHLTSPHLLHLTSRTIFPTILSLWTVNNLEDCYWWW